LIRRNLPISVIFELVLCISRERVVSLPVLIVDSTSCGLSMLNRPLALPCPSKHTCERPMTDRQWSHYSNGDEKEESVLRIEEIID